MAYLKTLERTFECLFTKIFFLDEELPQPVLVKAPLLELELDFLVNRRVLEELPRVFIAEVLCLGKPELVFTLITPFILLVEVIDDFLKCAVVLNKLISLDWPNT